MDRVNLYMELLGNRLAGGDNPDIGEAPNGGDDISTPVEHYFSPDGEDPESQGEVVIENDDGSSHVTIYDSEDNDRISADYDSDGNESGVHYTNQGAEKGDDNRH